MDYINAALLGIIEGITEFLPISSTGHLIIAEQWLGARSELFNIVIQAGAILAVTFIYWRRLMDLLLGWRDPQNRAYAAKLIVAFLITAVLGLIVKKLGFELPETVTPIAWALIIGGIWMIFAEWAAARRPPIQEHHLVRRHPGRHRPDRRRRLSRNLALRRHDLRRHAGRHRQPRRRNRIRFPRRHSDHVCGQRL